MSTQGIFFVNWKQHKIEEASKQVDVIAKSFLDDILFTTIMDYYRKNVGYPNALPLKALIENEPVLPENTESPEQIQFEAMDVRRTQKCPVCNSDVDGRLFTSHLETCIGKKPIQEVINSIFNGEGTEQQI